LLKGAATSNPTFTGTLAMKEYGVLRGGGPLGVPVENTGGPGTRNSHWRETVFRNELMSGFIAGPGNPLSRVTVASLEDIGYLVDINAAEPYTLPNLLEAAELGLLVPHLSAPHAQGMVLPRLPTVLPDDSLV
jgi:leishmanolysin